MDADRIIEHIETLTLADLRRVLAFTAELVERIEGWQQPAPIAAELQAASGGHYRQEFVRCGKDNCKKCSSGKGHGPYWYRYTYVNGKTKKMYIGKEKPL